MIYGMSRISKCIIKNDLITRPPNNPTYCNQMIQEVDLDLNLTSFKNHPNMWSHRISPSHHSIPTQSEIFLQTKWVIGPEQKRWTFSSSILEHNTHIISCRFDIILLLDSILSVAYPKSFFSKKNLAFNENFVYHNKSKTTLRLISTTFNGFSLFIKKWASLF